MHILNWQLWLDENMQLGLIRQIITKCNQASKINILDYFRGYALSYSTVYESCLQLERMNDEKKCDQNVADYSHARKKVPSLVPGVCIVKLPSVTIEKSTESFGRTLSKSVKGTHSEVDMHGDRDISISTVTDEQKGLGDCTLFSDVGEHVNENVSTASNIVRLSQKYENLDKMDSGENARHVLDDEHMVPLENKPDSNVSDDIRSAKSQMLNVKESTDISMENLSNIPEVLNVDDEIILHLSSSSKAKSTLSGTIPGICLSNKSTDPPNCKTPISKEAKVIEKICESTDNMGEKGASILWPISNDANMTSENTDQNKIENSTSEKMDTADFSNGKIDLSNVENSTNAVKLSKNNSMITLEKEKMDIEKLSVDQSTAENSTSVIEKSKNDCPNTKESSANMLGNKKRKLLSDDLLSKVTVTVAEKLKHNPLELSEELKRPEDVVLSVSNNILDIEGSKDDASNSKDGDSICNVSALFSDDFEKSYIRHKKEAKQVSKKRKRHDDQNLAKEEKKPKKSKKIAPNYFLSVQVSNPIIHQNLEIVQKYMLGENQDLKKAMIALPTLHLTLMVMHLATEEDVESAIKVLDKCQTGLEEIATKDPVVLSVQGIGNFKDEVVFAKVIEGEQLDQLNKIADHVTQVFKDNGIQPSDDKGFKPHITILKLSKVPRLKKKGIKKVGSKYYSPYKDSLFGKQTVSGVQLCAMLKRKDEKGYYHVAHNISCVVEDLKEDDSTPLLTLLKRPTESMGPNQSRSYHTDSSNRNCTGIVEFEKELHWIFTLGQ